MKIICAVLLAVIISFELRAQTNFYNQSQINLKPLMLKTPAAKFNESTYHLGVEYAPIIDITEKYTLDEYWQIMWGFYDVSIAEKKLYFRIEIGGMSDIKFKGGALFATLGLNYRVMKISCHNIYLLLGLEGWAGGQFGGFFGVINPKYVLMLSNKFGLSAGVRYMPWISFVPLDMGKGFVCVSAGVQFFY